MRRRCSTLIVIAWAATSLEAQPLPPSAPCAPQRAADSTVSFALNCLMLVPVPDLPDASGVVVLRPVPSPFGVAVSSDGRQRHHLVATIAGLPDTRTLGEYGGYVAWAYTLALDSGVKLGTVVNGRVDLGELDREQFRILISAERSMSTLSRNGPLVLRGTSPGARLLAHRDLLQPSAPGAVRDSAPVTGRAMPSTAEMAGMAALKPGVTPFLPGDGVSSAKIRSARPRGTIHVTTGDTLALEAGLVRRTIAGKAFTMYGFNGRVIGPLIDAAQGTTFRARYHNALGQPSSIHWHGVRLDNRSDGAVDVTQKAVLPGESFTYIVHLPDAGIYWYHPHVREDVQQDLGLYGNLLVRPRNAGYYSRVDREEVLMLDDVLLGADGLEPYGAESPVSALMGRFGNVFLVNGEPRYSLDVRRREVVRFFLTNAASARIFNVSFGGARMKVIGGDMGRFEHEEWVESVVIAPAERYIIEVEFPEPGMVAMVNRVQALDHLRGWYSPEIDTLGMIRVAKAPAKKRDGTRFAVLRQNGDVSREVTAFRRYADKPVDHDLLLTLRTRALPAAIDNMLIGINAPVEWNDGMPMMNRATTGKEITWLLRDPVTGNENMDIRWRFHQGDVVKLRLFNDPASSHAMDHPIHLHGQRFLVLARDGVPTENHVWKDTAIIPAGETADLLVDMSNPGRWMLHCHIAEHLSTGMMLAFTVEPRGVGGARRSAPVQRPL